MHVKRWSTISDARTNQGHSDLSDVLNGGLLRRLSLLLIRGGIGECNNATGRLTKVLLRGRKEARPERETADPLANTIWGCDCALDASATAQSKGGNNSDGSILALRPGTLRLPSALLLRWVVVASRMAEQKAR